MLRRLTILVLLFLLSGVAMWCLLPRTHRPALSSPSSVTKPAPAVLAADPKAFKLLSAAANPPVPSFAAYRLGNTVTPLGRLLRSDSAVLLENARIDTDEPLNLAIPAHLRSAGDPGAYIVQARGPVNGAFHAALRRVGATPVSYIPNNAWLVRGTAERILSLVGQPQIRAVIPFEPYFKLKASLLPLAADRKPMPVGTCLNLALFEDSALDTARSLAGMDVTVLGRGSSPFGPVLTVQARPDSLPSLAALPGVWLIERAAPRVQVNDLARVTTGVSSDTLLSDNYLGLSGENVLVAVADSGVDTTHPDLAGRIILNSPASGVDVRGHGTHVAAIIAGSGVSSLSVGTNAPGSVEGADFRGKAPAATVFSILLNEAPSVTGLDYDSWAQERAALTNARIHNNSWGSKNDAEYSILSAHYDAAVRDAVPGLPGSQPVTFVFAAGNEGGGSDDGQGGDVGSIVAPGTGKNVITVGSIEQFREINAEVVVDGQTNTPWAASTDSSSEVASSSSRGNVGVGVEGEYGRFKPDLVAPGVSVISARSSQWDEASYYNTTNRQQNTISPQAVPPYGLNQYQIFVPFEAVGLQIIAAPLDTSTNAVTNLNIYVRAGDFPTTNTYDAVGVGQISLPASLPLVPGSGYFYAVGNPTNRTVDFRVTTIITVTNDLGEQYRVMRQMNDALGGSYRFESGTSMAAPAVSGILALMQEFFEQRLHLTNSPALMKALLINGARSASSLYDLQVRSLINYQGWGLASLPTSLPSNTNSVPSLGTPTSFMFFDQDPTNALASGQSQTRTVTLDNVGLSRPLRFTLVWTDPPGNPAAGIKLVNDLDLVVTNLDTGEVFFGNDIPASSDFNTPWETNQAPPFDVVNNVENVFIASPGGTNTATNATARYSVTVRGSRVNVNAVTAHTNDVVQDYALVISSGNGEVADAFTVAESPVVAGLTANVTVFTNATAIPIFNQVAGASTPLISALNGITNQWQFYVITNYGTNANFTNAAFITFLPPTLSAPRAGVRAVDDPDEISRPEADIDMYVSTDSGLLNLDPAVLSDPALTSRSIGRGGTEVVTFSNSAPGMVYYIGVKSEDQMAGQFGFLGAFSDRPFSEKDADGNTIVHGIGVPMPIPDGTPSRPQAAIVFGIVMEPLQVRRVMVTNTLDHQNLGDLFGELEHGGVSVVLNDHTYGDGTSPQTFIYDDSGEVQESWVRKSDGPGTLEDFAGLEGIGVWRLTMIDNAWLQTGRVDNLTFKIIPQRIEDEGDYLYVYPYSWAYTFIEVPVEATNLTISVVNRTATTPLPVEVYVRRDERPTFTEYDKRATVFPGFTNSLSISKADLPPLQAGTYFIGIYNPNAIAQEVRVTARLDLDLNGVSPTVFSSTNTVPLLDDAITNSIITVTNDLKVISAEVGVRLNHPRVSDLALTLTSPQGTRVLLFENRGGTNSVNLGTDLVATTNLYSGNGDFNATNISLTPVTNGTLVLDYNFIGTNTLSVYDDTNQIATTGMTNDIDGQLVLAGPFSTNSIEIRVNEGGSADTNALWTLAVSSEWFGGYRFLNFTENTNRVSDPTNLLKFASPDFTAPTYTGTNAAYTNLIVYLPEESLDAFEKEDAQGDWKLEIWDSRVGATNPAPELLGWSLSLIFEQPAVSAILLEPFVTITSTVPAGGMEYLIADVPPWAAAATNYLLSADLPLFVWFNQNGAPTGGTNDYSMFDPAPVTNGVTTLVTNPVPPMPPLLPGRRYYLGVQNTNAFPVTYSYRVDYDITTLTNAVPFVGVAAPGGIPRYFAYEVSTNATAVAYDLSGLDGNMNLVARQGAPLPTLFSHDYASFNTGTNDEQIVVFTNSVPVSLRPGRWYLGVFNATAATVNYTLQATEFTNAFPDIVTLTNGIPFVAGNNAGPGASQYFRFPVLTNMARVQFEITGASGDFTLVAARGLPLPDLSVYDYRSANAGTNDELIVVLTNSVPVSLAAGDWFLAAVKISPGPAAYSIMATGWPFTGRPVQTLRSGIIGTDFCITWASLPGVHYFIEGRTNFASPAWVAVSPTITADDYTTTWCIPLPTPYAFFRVAEGVATNASTAFPAVISNISVSPAGVTLTWFGPIAAIYQVQWTDSLSPANWQTDPVLVTSASGVFSYTNAAPAAAGRFYRLIQLP